MPISGSDPALMRAQSGIIRSGASRSGYYTPFTVKITIKGVDWTSKIDKRSITVQFDERQSAAQFQVVDDSSGTYPQYGEVVVTQGSTGNRLFGGYVTLPSFTRRRARSRARIALGCVDYSWVLDRYAVVGKLYLNRGVMTILGDLLTQLPSGQRFFTPDNDGCVFSTNIDFQANHTESIASAINRLANRVGAQWYCDAYKVVHFYVPGSQAGIGSATALSDSATHFWGLHVTPEPSQVRTRIYSHGGRSVVSAATGAGSTTLPLDDTTLFGASGGEALVGANYIAYTGKTTTELTGVTGLSHAVGQGEDARVLAVRNNTSAQTSFATAIGNSYLATDDGVVAHSIEDGSATDQAARDNGDGELLAYASIPIELSYLTRDMRAMPNRTISTASLTLPWTVGSSQLIRSVTITGFGMTTKRPARQVVCGGRQVELATLLAPNPDSQRITR